MTTGHEGHGTDCSEALLRLYEFLDGEIGPEDGAKIQAHLDECERCLRQYRMDQTLKALVRRACGCEPAPPALRLMIMSRITSVRVERHILDD